MRLRKAIRISYRVVNTTKIISKRLKEAAISAFSGQAAFFLILSFFPFAMFLFSILKYTPLSSDILLTAISEFLPYSFRDFIINLLQEIYDNQPGSVLPVTIITAVWLGSKSFMALIQGLNSMYEIEESRNYIIVRFCAFLYTIFFALLIIALLTVIVFGNSIYFYVVKRFPLLNHTFLSIISLRSIVSFCILFLFFILMYKTVPARHSTFANGIPGALLSASGWLGFSYLYSYYVDHFSNYSAFYGTMTTIALLMIWLYACMYILFLGGMVNYILDDHHPSNADISCTRIPEK